MKKEVVIRSGGVEELPKPTDDEAATKSDVEEVTPEPEKKDAD